MIALLSLSFFLGRRTSRIYVSEYTDKHFIDSLIFYFDKLKKGGQDEEIIRLGIALSTPLWFSQSV